ncbi:MAG: sigma-54 interaction domain-containing protein [Candidatus Tectimicrobiota bacterium]
MTSSHLAPQLPVPLAPELLLAVRPDHPALIVDIAPRLAAWTGHGVAELVGQPVAEVFHDIMPGLPLAVEEMVRSGQMLSDYPLAMTDHQGVQRQVLLQAVLRPGAAHSPYHLVACRLEEVPARAPDSEAPEVPEGFHGLLGRSAALARVLRKIEIYGPTDAPVLITGETGTGKELVARALHACSQRQHRPFVAVNCAALSEELLESELFGHEKGAFTSAVRAHRGRFERAHGGTLFLDEIGDMPLRVQVKLLRVLEEGVIERVGGEREIAVDVRLEAATNVPLELAVQARTFRADLYHRLAVLRIHLPPLRQRLEDLPLLTAHFLQHLNHKYQRQVRRLSPEAQALLAAYSWPGNIRELRNVLERVYIETAGEVIGRKAFDEWVEEREQFSPGAWNVEARQTALAERPVWITPYPGTYRVLPVQGSAEAPGQQTIDMAPGAFTYLDPQTPARQPSQASTVEVVPPPLTAHNIMQAYRRAGGNLTQAARLLGVHRATLYRHMQALGVTRADLAAALGASTSWSLPAES